MGRISLPGPAGIACLSLVGCMSWGVESTYPDWPKGWDSPLLVAGGWGVLVTFDADMKTADGQAYQLGWGKGTGGGIRLMDFSHQDDPSGKRYDARSYMGYWGVGGGRGRGDTGGYAAFSLGATRIVGSGEDDHGLAGGFNIGVCKYHDFARHGGFGVAAEAGLFLSEAADVPLHGMTFLVGVYAYF